MTNWRTDPFARGAVSYVPTEATGNKCSYSYILHFGKVTSGTKDRKTALRIEFLNIFLLQI